MCGIAGIVGKNLIENKVSLLRDLADLTLYRGNHATGIGFIEEGGLKVCKAPISPKNVGWQTLFAFAANPTNDKIIYHNRFATNGAVSQNKNNHPFVSRDDTFMLAHNGVLNNYKGVLSQHSISIDLDEPETDSYSIVRLIEKFRNEGLSMIDSISKASGLFAGSSLCLEILDAENNLYLVRGDKYSFDLYQVGDGYIYASSPSNASYPSSVNVATKDETVKSLEDVIFRNIKSICKNNIFIKKIDVPIHTIIMIDKDNQLTVTSYKDHLVHPSASAYNKPVSSRSDIRYPSGQYYGYNGGFGYQTSLFDNEPEEELITFKQFLESRNCTDLEDYLKTIFEYEDITLTKDELKKLHKNMVEKSFLKTDEEWETELIDYFNDEFQIDFETFLKQFNVADIKQLLTENFVSSKNRAYLPAIIKEVESIQDYGHRLSSEWIEDIEYIVNTSL